jgi:hypothetical protein
MKWIKVFMITFLIGGCASQEPNIHTFQECETHGGVIMESYPRQCRIESIEKTFVEKIEAPWDENDFEIIQSENKSCETKEDCQTPPEYLIRSNCPYSSRCIENECFTVCPKPFSSPQ